LREPANIGLSEAQRAQSKRPHARQAPTRGEAADGWLGESEQGTGFGRGQEALNFGDVIEHGVSSRPGIPAMN
jgi:hypothetical protein